MPIARSEIETFFAEYAAALAGRDPKIILTYWGVPAFVLGNEGPIAVGRVAETEQFVR